MSGGTGRAGRSVLHASPDGYTARMIDRQLLAPAMPTCGQDGCEQPWLRVEWSSYSTPDGWRPKAIAVCEYGHRVPVEPVLPSE